MNTKRTLLMLSALATFASASMASAQPNGGKRFEKLDANKDGVVTLVEFESRAVARFDKADTNKDGKITPEERKAAHEAFKAERADKGERAERGHKGPRGEHGKRGERPDADKTFTKAELTNKVKEHFSKLDKNSDGKLTQDEMKFGGKGRGHGECEKGKKPERV